MAPLSRAVGVCDGVWLVVGLAAGKEYGSGFRVQVASII